MKRRTASAEYGALLAAIRSFVYGLPLFVSRRPRTALRVLCLIAFDTIHRVRMARPLPRPQLRILAALLDLGACANAALDKKASCPEEFRELLQLLEEGSIDLPVAEYLHRLSALERDRPWSGGRDPFPTVRSYREAVVRLSLGMVAATSRGVPSLEEGIRAICNDADLHLLFRIVMQCQIIDDVVDYASDLSARLPSFLTATRSLAQGFNLTSLAAADYANDRDEQEGELLPLRVALILISMLTRFVIRLGRWRYHADVTGCYTQSVISLDR